MLQKSNAYLLFYMLFKKVCTKQNSFILLKVPYFVLFYHPGAEICSN